MQVQQRNGCFLSVPAAAKQLPQRKIGSLWRRETDEAHSNSATMTSADVMEMVVGSSW